VIHRIALLLLTLTVCATVTMAAIRPKAGQKWDLDGFLVKRGSAAAPEYWLVSSRPGMAGVTPEWEARLLDGVYPRSLDSIYAEYGSEHRVIILGSGTDGGELKLDLLKPAFIPYVPVPLQVTKALVTGHTLKIIALASPEIPREKFIWRTGRIHLGPVMRADFWVECPDPRFAGRPETVVPRTFTLDLKSILHLTPPTIIEVHSGKSASLITNW
jgi:hypothetical protein